MDSFMLAANVVAGGFNPDNVLVLLRGAATAGGYVHEMLSKVYGYRLDYDARKTRRVQTGTHGVTPQYNIVIDDADHPPEFTVCTRLLIVDDMFDTGRTIEEVISWLVTNGLDEDRIRVATVDYKPEKNQTQRVPDYYINMHPANAWIVYPQEISDVADEDIEEVFGSKVSNLLLMCQDVVKVRKDCNRLEKQINSM